MNFANKVTIFRILATPFFIGTILYYTPERDYLRFISLGIFLLAVLSDAIDGYIARTKSQRTKAGTILDPLADKILLSSAFICMYTKGSLNWGLNLPLWIVLVVITRDIIILLGSAVIYIVKQNLVLVPTKWGKFTTTFQMLSIICVLLRFSWTIYVWWTTALLTVISGIQYIRGGSKVLYVNENHGPHN